jgi:hypothetical protein
MLPKLYDGRNKTFFFHNMERTKQKNYSQTSFTTLPMPEFQQGDFRRILNPAFTGNSVSGSSAGP